MFSPIRIYTLITNFLKTERTILVNLTRISSIELQNKLLIINLSHEHRSIG